MTLTSDDLDTTIPDWLRRKPGQKPAPDAGAGKVPKGKIPQPEDTAKALYKERLGRLTPPARALFEEHVRKYMSRPEWLDDPSVVAHWESQVKVVAEKKASREKAKEERKREKQAALPPKLKLISMRQIVTEMSVGRKERIKKRVAMKLCNADSELQLQRGRFPPAMVERVKAFIESKLKGGKTDVKKNTKTKKS